MTKIKANTSSQAAKSWQVARQRLHVSAVPEALPCRDLEFMEITAHLEGALESRHGTCLYISGVPGTGKTATVRSVLRQLQERAQDQQVPPFQSVEINGMALTEANYAYTVLWQQLSGGEKVSPAVAQGLLEDWFENATVRNRRGKVASSMRTPCIVIMDELDQLVTKKQTVMYNFFNWPMKPQSNLIVIAIANTMDLPERILSNKISSRLGLTRINFQPYTFKQLQEIIASRLEGLNVFDEKAIEMAARKVSAVSGDARRALDVCRRAAELVQYSKQKQATVDLLLVKQAIDELYSSPSVRTMMGCSLHMKLFVFALTSCLKTSGLTEAEFGDVAKRHVDLCRVHNVEPPTTSDLVAICTTLGTIRILLVQTGKNGGDIYQRLRLNIADGDVWTAFRQDAFMQRFAS